VIDLPQDCLVLRKTCIIQDIQLRTRISKIDLQISASVVISLHTSSR